MWMEAGKEELRELQLERELLTGESVGLSSPSHAGRAREGAEATGRVRETLGVRSLPSAHSIRQHSRGKAQSPEESGVEGCWQSRRPGLAASWAAGQATRKSQSSVSCLMFSMGTGSSGLGALSGVATSRCSSFTRTVMTEEEERWGAGRRECACNSGKGAASGSGEEIRLPTDGPSGHGKGSPFPLCGGRQHRRPRVPSPQPGRLPTLPST